MSFQIEIDPKATRAVALWCSVAIHTDAEVMTSQRMSRILLSAEVFERWIDGMSRTEIEAAFK